MPNDLDQFSGIIANQVIDALCSAGILRDEDADRALLLVHQEIADGLGDFLSKLIKV